MPEADEQGQMDWPDGAANSSAHCVASMLRPLLMG
jgi:hypothetical protein